MNKIKPLSIIIGFVLLIYLLLAAFMPVITTIVTDSSELVAEHPHIDDFSGAEEGLQVMPWLLWFVPGFIGIVAIVVVMRREE